MRPELRSIFSQLLVSFLFVVVLTITVSILLEYRSFSTSLPRIITETRSRAIAQHLSATYSRDGGWNSIEPEMQKLNNLDNLNNIDRTGIRIVVRDSSGRTVYNSFYRITRLQDSELIEGESEQIFDYGTGGAVGVVTLYISRDYILGLSRDYISKLLLSGLLRILFTAGISVTLSIILSLHISRPITRLTEAVISIADGRMIENPEISSPNEIRSLNRAFNSMSASLQAQKKLRQQLIADVAHEITAPLNAVRLEARALSDGFVEAGEASTNIINEIDALHNLVYDLNWLAETDSGEFRLNREEYDMTKLLSDEIGRWKHKADSTGTAILLKESRNKLPAVFIDVTRMSAVIGNLIENAIKYAGAGCIITVSCRIEANYVTVSVCDDGKAIAAGHRSRIFERFYRIDQGSTPIAGRGLGLSIVKQIVELHGGRIILECEEARGNCFNFSIPFV